MSRNLQSTFTLFLLTLSTALRAQVVTIDPVFATQNDFVTITFDATKGNAALSGQSVVYAHAGVITNFSTSPTDWRHVQGTWGTADNKVKMTAVGNNKFQLSYQIRTFYNVPANEQVLKLAFVFRNQDGSVVGRNADGTDIFVELSTGGAFQLNLTSNAAGVPAIIGLSDSIVVNGVTSDSAQLSLYVNNTLQANIVNGKSIAYTFYGSAAGYGKHIIRLEALDGTTLYKDSLVVIVRPSSASNIAVSPVGTSDGINYLNDSTVLLQLLAPQKNYVYVVGDFNNWEPDPAYEMTRTPDGQRYWLVIGNLTKGSEYAFQYSINKEQLRVADPFADKLLDQFNDPYIPASVYPSLKAYPAGKTNGYVSVLQTGQEPFVWQHSAGFNRPPSDNLVIYELLVRDFIAKHDYKTLTDTLDYIQRLGVNAIELMPVNEFEGNESWGYNTAFYFAPDKYYGTKTDLKRFIDECHRRGIAVIMDMVLNHSFGQSSMVRMYFDQVTGKPLNNPWFNADAKHPFNVGYDFNHESQFTKNFVDTVLKYWINEYKMDGYRFDLSKGFTQTNNPDNVGAWGAYDQSRINIWKRIYDQIKPSCPDCYYILEHFADNSEEKVLADYGMMLWGNMNHAFNEATMGYTSDLSGASYKNRNWNNPNLVSYAESHDEERLMYKNIQFGSVVGNYSIKDTTTGLSRIEPVAAIMAALPGPYMIWQFGELGYDYSIDFNGRVGNKPIRWDYLGNNSRRRVYDIYAALNKLKTTHGVFRTRDFSYSLNQPFKTVRLNDSSMSVIAMANFGTASNTSQVVFPFAGWWYDLFTGDSIEYTTVTNQITLAPGGYRWLTSKRLEKPQVTQSTALEEIYDNGVSGIYPNPAGAGFNVITISPVVSYRIMDLSGRIMTVKADHGSSWIPTDSLVPGLYMVEITTRQGTSVHKLIINR